MSIRLTCPSCHAAFLTADDRLGQSVACPKCGAEQVVPATVLASPSEATTEAGAVWVARDELPEDASPVKGNRNASLPQGGCSQRISVRVTRRFFCNYSEAQEPG